jgi:aryl-alcohol dehydrogenase-like predicted oxidoreductase
MTTMAMQNRVLGRTGVSVSPLCLGAMMFGPWGNNDEADCIRVIVEAQWAARDRRRWRRDAASSPASTAGPPARFDMTSPAGQRKLEVVEELAQLADKADLTLIEVAIAFVINHPAVTSAIIGPRTMEQLESQLTAAEITLTADILDRIDQLVAPGVTINPDDNSYGEAELTPATLRRIS